MLVDSKNLFTGVYLIMEIICERPYALFALLALIPVLILTIKKNREIVGKLKILYVKTPKSMIFKRVSYFSIVIILRFVFRSLAWVMMVLAYAGICWGTKFYPVQKNGNAVSFVFDVSYSMMAEDASGGLSRLEASKKYANLLLSEMEGIPVSVVLAKGDGMMLVPDTEDRAAVETLLECLSPRMMTSKGSGIGKGILAALNGISSKSVKLHRIFVFTDGDETDGSIEYALRQCMNKSVSVSIIGFGNERESLVFAGDGKTKVWTALRSEKLASVCDRVMKTSVIPSGSDCSVRFIDATQAGSIKTLLDFTENQSGDENYNSAVNIYYEVRPISRSSLFMSLAIVFFVLSFITVELDPDFFKRRMSKMGMVSVIFCVFSLLSFTSCSPRVEGAAKILSGTWSWNQQKWADATSCFLNVSESALACDDKELNEYAVFNLGATYLSMNEDEAALKRFKEISENAPKELRYSAFYNMGIIHYKKTDYESAAEYFKKALCVDSKQREAKINLELSIRNANAKEKVSEDLESSASKLSQPSDMGDSIFNRIRENDMNQWRSSETFDESSALDY